MFSNALQGTIGATALGGSVAADLAAGFGWRDPAQQCRRGPGSPSGTGSLLPVRQPFARGLLKPTGAAACKRSDGEAWRCGLRSTTQPPQNNLPDSEWVGLGRSWG